MATVVAIRVDGDSYRDKLRDFLSSDGGSLCVRETVDGDNPHYHAVLHSERKVPAIRMALKRALGLNGNGDYSVAEVRDLPKYLRYMMKGACAEVGPEVIMAVGMEYGNADWQRGQHAAFWADASADRRKRKLEPIMEATYKTCLDEGVSYDQRDRIAKIYIRGLIDRDRPINIFSAKSAINLLQCKLCPDDSALDNLVASV